MIEKIIKENKMQFKISSIEITNFRQYEGTQELTEI